MDIPFTVVIITASSQVDRFGYEDFENDGSFDPETETILTPGFFAFDPGLDKQDWYWNGSTFQKTPP